MYMLLTLVGLCQTNGTFWYFPGQLIVYHHCRVAALAIGETLVVESSQV
jgi:hypothetical protein